MAQALAVYEHGPLTYEDVSEWVTGRQVVEFAPDGKKIRPAADGSAKWLGVALYDSMPNNTPQHSTTAWGAPHVDHSVPVGDLAVAYNGVFKLLFASDAGPGDHVVCASQGRVKALAAGATPPFGSVVGQVVQPGGVVSGSFGLVLLSRA